MILGRPLSEDELLVEIDAHCQDRRITRSMFLRRARGNPKNDGVKNRNREILAGYDAGESMGALAQRFNLRLKHIHGLTNIRRPSRPKIFIPMADGSFKIPLTFGLAAIIDAEDLDLVIRFQWQTLHIKGAATSYAMTYDPSGEPKRPLMHRMIMEPAQGVLIDHINGNGLDNRRRNLRMASVAQNAWNTKRRALPASGYRGVKPLAEGYKGIIRVHGNDIATGVYDTAEAAARARDALALRHHGEFAVLNFPREDAVTSSRGGPGT